MAFLTRARAGLAAAVLMTAGACEFIHPPTYVSGDPNQLLVHAVLEAGDDTAAVLVTRVGGAGGPLAVAGAQVRIIGADGQAVLMESTAERTPCSSATLPPGSRNGCYVAALSTPLRAGAEYRLEVDVATGERVRGSTTIPPLPVLHSPRERLRVPAEYRDGFLRGTDSVLVRWTANDLTSLTSGVERVWGPNAEGARCSSQLSRWYYATGGRVDSARVQVDVVGCNTGFGQEQFQVRPDSVEVVLGVTTYDGSYLAYIQTSDEGIPLEKASSGLEGAFGLFGSAATARRRIILVTR
jgi:hypothetical protein